MEEKDGDCDSVMEARVKLPDTDEEENVSDRVLPVYWLPGVVRTYMYQLGLYQSQQTHMIHMQYPSNVK